MKALAILLILLGPMIAAGSWIYGVRESDRRLAIWVQNENAAMTLAARAAEAERRIKVARLRPIGDLFGTSAALTQAVTALRAKTQVVAKLREQIPELDAILKDRAPVEARALLHAMAPASTQVSAWPGLLAGLGCSAFGILLLAIVGNRPRRAEDELGLVEMPKFKWRKR